jgi:hypothetical protein
MNKILITLAAVGLGILVAASSLAQPPDGDPPKHRRGPHGDGPPHGPPGPPVMVVLDTDRDGTLSSEEIAAAPEALKKLDKNDDGELTEEELRPPHPPHHGPGGPGGPGDFHRGPRRGGPDGDGPPGDGPRGDGPRGDRPRGDGPQRDFGPGGEARGPRVLPPGAADRLDLSDEQREKIAALEKEVRTKVEEILKPEQLAQLKEMRPHGPGRGGPEGPPEGPRGPRPPRD